MTMTKQERSDHEQKVQTKTAAAFALVLRDFTNPELAAFNNGIQGFGHCPPVNLAHSRAVDAKLIKEDGSPWDVEALKTASAYEVNRRVDAGTFN